jgi:hypothetical protein
VLLSFFLDFLIVSRAIETFAALGIPLTEASCRTAETILKTMFSFRQPEELPFGDQLTSVIGELIDHRKPERVVIPLSAGNDSRGLLGATLRVFPKDRILCVTVGEGRNEEVLGARSICRRLGIEHRRVDPIKFGWPIDRAIAACQRTATANSVFRSVDLILFDEIARYCTPRTIVFSGWFGDTAAGGRWRWRGPVVRDGNDPEQALAMFLRKNGSSRDRVVDQAARDISLDFGMRTKRWMVASGFPAVTLYEAMDIGLRQILRIRANTMLGDAEVYAPYTDQRLLSFWFNRSPEDRFKQNLYHSSIKVSFPEVFSLPKDRSAAGSQNAQRSSKGAMGRRVDVLLDRVLGASERADVLYGENKRLLITELLDKLELRQCLPGWDISDVRQRYLAGPSGEALTVARTLASLEAHLSAGTLERMEDPEKPVAYPSRFRPSA